MSIYRPAPHDRRSAGWCSGLFVNLMLSLLYLLVAPLTAAPHRDWAVLVGSYFAAFLLADSATTNALGSDARRVSRHLSAGTSLCRILLNKNLTLMLAVGLPILVAAALITVQNEPAERLGVTIPAVLGPILAWLGLGNVASVLLPVAPVPLRTRWRQRRDLVTTGRWLVVMALPYALCFVVDLLSRVPTLVFQALGRAAGTSVVVPATVLLATGLITYGGLSGLALRICRLRPLPFHDAPSCAVDELAVGSTMALAA